MTKKKKNNKWREKMLNIWKNLVWSMELGDRKTITKKLVLDWQRRRIRFSKHEKHDWNVIIVYFFVCKAET